MPIEPDSSQKAPPLVEVRNLFKSFDEKPVLQGIDASFQAKKTTVVLGPSGCGKSVLLKHLIGLLRPDSGEVYFDGTRVDTIPEKHMTKLRRQFGFLFQMGALFDSLDVRGNIEFPLREADVHSAEERDHRAIARCVHKARHRSHPPHLRG